MTVWVHLQDRMSRDDTRSDNEIHRTRECELAVHNHSDRMILGHINVATVGHGDAIHRLRCSMAHDRLQRSIAYVRLYHERWSVGSIIMVVLGE
jgi:hypothetical protein